MHIYVYTRVTCGHGTKQTSIVRVERANSKLKMNLRLLFVTLVTLIWAILGLTTAGKVTTFKNMYDNPEIDRLIRKRERLTHKDKSLGRDGLKHFPGEPRRLRETNEEFASDEPRIIDGQALNKKQDEKATG